MNHIPELVPSSELVTSPVIADFRYHRPIIGQKPDGSPRRMDLEQSKDGDYVNFTLLLSANRRIERLARRVRWLEREYSAMRDVLLTQDALEEKLAQRLKDDPGAADLWSLVQSIAALKGRKAA